MVEKMVSVREKPDSEGTGDFWQGKTPCWEMCHCPEAVKDECPAPKYPSLPCWEIEGTYCKLTPDGTSGRDSSICRLCRVYKRWGGNKPIELKLSGRGVDSFRRTLKEKTDLALLENSEAHGIKAQLYPDILERRQEMQSNTLVEVIDSDTLDEIIDRDNGNGDPLSKILKDIQDECDWLPREILEHVCSRLEVSPTKVYRTAIFGKGINILPRTEHLVDDRICVIDLLKHYLDFLRHDLCGKCLPCREGTRQMYNIVSDIAEGKGEEKDIELLKETAEWVAELSACNQGVIAANIVLTAVTDCRKRIEAHIKGEKSPVSVYTSL